MDRSRFVVRFTLNVKWCAPPCSLATAFSNIELRQSGSTLTLDNLKRILGAKLEGGVEL